ncbi:MAG: hypothetical protein LC781_21705 [Actinobacteria bacterium]|nr:hypothetical protein [Actinomycetota bacterium]
MVRNVVKLGVVAITALLMFTAVASAAQAQGQHGKGQGKAYGLDRQPVCHNGKTLYLPAPAVVAHERHGDTAEECGDVGTPPGGGGDPGDGGGNDSLVGLEAQLLDEDSNGFTDLLRIPATGCTIDPVAKITLKQGTELFTFNNGVNASITNGDTALEIRDPIGGGLDVGLTTTGGPITVVVSSGIECSSVAVAGKVATKDGAPVLKTSSGDMLKLSTDSKRGKDTLKSAKGKQVQVKGKLSKGKTLEVKAVKAKGKR